MSSTSNHELPLTGGAILVSALEGTRTMRALLVLVAFTSMLLCATPNDGWGQQPRTSKKTAPSTSPTEKKSKADPNALRQAAMINAGDPKRGKAIFASPKTKCATCHKVHGQGVEVGPDLSQIGGKFDRIHLIESILDPSAEIPAGYHGTVIETRAGRVCTGVVRSESSTAV